MSRIPARLTADTWDINSNANENVFPAASWLSGQPGRRVYRYPGSRYIPEDHINILPDVAPRAISLLQTILTVPRNRVYEYLTNPQICNNPKSEESLRPSLTACRPNVNIPMVVDLGPVFGAEPKASLTLVKWELQVFSCRTMYSAISDGRVPRESPGRVINRHRVHFFSSCRRISPVALKKDVGCRKIDWSAWISVAQHAPFH